MRALRAQATAVVVVLALLCSVPAVMPRACATCPADCPMHHQAGGSHRVGCHEGHLAPPVGGCVMGPGCGHASAEAATLETRGPVPPSITVAPLVSSSTLVDAPVRVSTRVAPEPPSEPPRSRPV